MRSEALFLNEVREEHVEIQHQTVYLSGLAFSILIHMFLIIYHYRMWHKPANQISKSWAHVDSFSTTLFPSAKINPKKTSITASTAHAGTLVVVLEGKVSTQESKVSTQESSRLSGNEMITVFAMIWFVFLRTGITWLEKPQGNCENSGYLHNTQVWD